MLRSLLVESELLDDESDYINEVDLKSNQPKLNI